MFLVLGRAVSGIGPNVAGRIAFVDQIRQLRAVTQGGVRRRPSADQAMSPIDADVVLVAKGGNRDINALRPILGGLGLRELDRPARVAVLLA